MASYEKDLDDILKRLRRIEGQVRGLQRMVTEGQYCVDVLTQISSVKRATEQVALIVLQDHIRGCVQNSMSEGNADQSIDELVEAVERFLKT